MAGGQLACTGELYQLRICLRETRAQLIGGSSGSVEITVKDLSGINPSNAVSTAELSLEINSLLHAGDAIHSVSLELDGVPQAMVSPHCASAVCIAASLQHSRRPHRMYHEEDGGALLLPAVRAAIVGEGAASDTHVNVVVFADSGGVTAVFPSGTASRSPAASSGVYRVYQGTLQQAAKPLQTRGWATWNPAPGACGEVHAAVCVESKDKVDCAPLLIYLRCLNDAPQLLLGNGSTSVAQKPSTGSQVLGSGA